MVHTYTKSNTRSDEFKTKERAYGNTDLNIWTVAQHIFREKYLYKYAPNTLYVKIMHLTFPSLENVSTYVWFLSSNKLTQFDVVSINKSRYENTFL